MHFFQSNFQVKILALYNRIGSVMVSVVDWNAVDRGFIGSVMVSVVDWNAVDRGFIGSVMVSVVDWNAVDRGFKDYTIGNCCFSIKPSALRRKTGLLGIRIMCPSGATCLSADCYFSELEL
jgi:hypothetical protein